MATVLIACGGSESQTAPDDNNITVPGVVPGQPLQSTAEVNAAPVESNQSTDAIEQSGNIEVDEADHDNDDIGDNADIEDDNNSIAENPDLLPLNSVEAVDTDNYGLVDNSDPDSDNDDAPNEADVFPFDGELISLQESVQGAWQTECQETPGSEGNAYHIEGVEFTDTEIRSVIAYYNDALCRNYFFTSFPESSAEFISSVSYGEVLQTIDDTKVMRIDIGETQVIRAFNSSPDISPQQIVGIEDSALYFGQIDANSPGHYELSRVLSYYKVDSLIAQVNITITPVVVRPNPFDPVVTEDRTRPPQGSVFTSEDNTLKYNGADLFSDIGPQQVDSSRVVSWPGLRYGDFLVSNNPWNASAASYPLWFQEISLTETTNGYAASFAWDWGAQADTSGSIFNPRSFPEVIYGTKSALERSGTFANTGLPVEIYDSPEITIGYSYDYEARPSVSTTPGGTESEFNVAIESFFHSSCDIKRSGGPDDNTVFELMVWLKTGDRKPSGRLSQKSFKFAIL